MTQRTEIRLHSADLCARACALISRAEIAATKSGALRARGARRRGHDVEPATERRDLPVGCVPPPPATIEEAAERAFLLDLTAREIAAYMEQPVDLVFLSADRTALSEARPIDDVLRDWFRALLR
jgi:hypothetical protein